MLKKYIFEISMFECLFVCGCEGSTVNVVSGTAALDTWHFDTWYLFTINFPPRFPPNVFLTSWDLEAGTLGIVGVTL